METLAAQRVIVHGDYHVGQILIESVTGDVWLLDLDDLALDQPESDLGNPIEGASKNIENQESG